MSEQLGPNEAELIVLRYGEWMRSGTGPGPCTASEVVSQIRAQHPSKRFLSGDHVFRHYGIPVVPREQPAWGTIADGGHRDPDDGNGDASATEQANE